MARKNGNGEGRCARQAVQAILACPKQEVFLVYCYGRPRRSVMAREQQLIRQRVIGADEAGTLVATLKGR